MTEHPQELPEIVVGSVSLEAALYDCRRLAARHRKEEWAQAIMRFCAGAGITGRGTYQPFNGVAEGVEKAAQWVEHRLAKTGAREYPGNEREYPGNGDEYVEELSEIIKGIRAIASRMESPVVQGWVSVNEQLPEVDQRVLAYCVDWPENSDQPFLAHIGRGGFGWYDTRRGNLIPVTHWRCLPDAPTGDAPSAACPWTVEATNPDEDVWVTGCGEAHLFGNGGPVENNMHWCCYCGLKLITAHPAPPTESKT